MSHYVLGGITGGLGRKLFVLVPGAIAVGSTDCNMKSEVHVARWVGSLQPVDNEPIHIINATGISKSAMLHKLGYTDGDEIEVNLLGNVRLLKYLRHLFKTRPGSTFTMLGSVTSHTAPVGTAVYTASKMALGGLTMVAAREYAPWGRVNLLELGYFDAGLIEQVPDVPSLIKTIPMQRLGDATDLVEAWKFIIACQYVTGSVVRINGGLA